MWRKHFQNTCLKKHPGQQSFDSKGSVDGTITNELNRTEGAHGNGIKLTGTGYMSMGQSYGDNITNQLTLSAWIKPITTTTDNTRE